jgi:hypothetical protein
MLAPRVYDVAASHSAEEQTKKQIHLLRRSAKLGD